MTTGPLRAVFTRGVVLDRIPLPDYRLQLSQNMALTPSLQWVNRPALRGDEEPLWILGLRLRVTF